MKNSRPSHRLASRITGLFALASWPLVGLLACSVYDGSMVTGAASLAGGGSTAGSAAEAGNAGSSVAGGKAGSATTEGGTSTAAGVGADAGKAGDAGGGSGGVAGTSVGGGGTSSGGGGTAGAAGSGNTELIDDMEDGDAEIELSGPRNGYWYVGGDLTAGATLTPPSTKFAMTELTGDRSSYVAHIKATGFTDWGSVMGFNFIELLTKVKPYDASAFCGVQFWGKAAASTTVRLRVPDIDTHQSGMVCSDPGTTGTACYDHFGLSMSFGTAWKQYTVKFTDLTQVGTGYHPPDGLLKTDQLMALEWALPASTKTYEIWIDDVAFTKCE